MTRSVAVGLARDMSRHHAQGTQMARWGNPLINTSAPMPEMATQSKMARPTGVAWPEVDVHLLSLRRAAQNRSE